MSAEKKLSERVKWISNDRIKLRSRSLAFWIRYSFFCSRKNPRKKATQTNKQYRTRENTKINFPNVKFISNMSKREEREMAVAGMTLVKFWRSLRWEIGCGSNNSKHRWRSVYESWQRKSNNVRMCITMYKEKSEASPSLDIGFTLDVNLMTWSMWQVSFCFNANKLLPFSDRLSRPQIAFELIGGKPFFFHSHHTNVLWNNGKWAWDILRTKGFNEMERENWKLSSLRFTNFSKCLTRKVRFTFSRWLHSLSQAFSNFNSCRAIFVPISEKARAEAENLCVTARKTMAAKLLLRGRARNISR